MHALCRELILVAVVSYNSVTIGAMGLCAFDDLVTSLKETHPPPQMTTSPFASRTPSCPLNMLYMNCTPNCIQSCQNPNGLTGCNNNCTEYGGCVCPHGFLWKGMDCVTPEECQCFVSSEIGVLTENDVYINNKCTNKCVCNITGGELTCDDDYRCDGNATCDVREDKRQCYCNNGFDGDGEHCAQLPIDCHQIFLAGHTEDGIYKIHPLNWTGLSFEVYCNMTIDGGGWTVFQRRVNGSTSFFRGWNEYKDGFGILDHEFWLGNDKLSCLTLQKDYELRIDIVNSYLSSYYAHYTLFRVKDETTNYMLARIKGYTGTTGKDAMIYHNKMNFSTYDRDMDARGNRNCAEYHKGAWWYNVCQRCNLNGDYHGSDINSIIWNGLRDDSKNLKYTEMKIRPR